MDRGLYTGALAMLARATDTEVIANNLANMSTVGFKRDTTVYSDFPSLYAHRLRDQYAATPLAVYDLAPPVGKIGTGVEVADIVTQHDMSPSQVETGNPLDMAIEGMPGVKQSYAFFEVMTPQGPMYTRAGNFVINADGFLSTQAGALVLGEKGPVKIDANNIKFDVDGTVYTNPGYTGAGTNMWDQRQALDKLRLVTFDNVEGLEKVGYTLFKATPESGAARTMTMNVKLRTGILEMSNVNVVREMVDLIKSQRSYEAAAKVVTTHDTLLGQAVSDVGRVG